MKIADPEPQNETESQSDSSLISISSASSSCQKMIAERDGVEYLSGWVAYKMKNKYANLGTYTHKSLRNVPSWVMDLSYGGLMLPSEDWLKTTQMMEKYFNKCHGGEFKFRKKIVKRLSDVIIQKHKDVEPELVIKYIKMRTIIRCRFLNKKNKERKCLKYLNMKRRSEETAEVSKLRKLNVFKK